MNCRHCQSPLNLTLVDLGSAPPSNAYLTHEALKTAEKYFPLRVLVCEKCWLVQTEDFVASADELFDENYAYFSGFSASWLKHSEHYVNRMSERFKLDHNSHVVEVAANDGYLLQYVKARGIPCTGIEPTASTAAAAREKGIDIVQEFFGVALADSLVAQGKQADLTAANNVLAHVPDINDFVSGFSRLLKPNGVATFEFPHLVNMIGLSQFDTIYHEHYSYISLTAMRNVFATNGLTIFDVEEIPTHGGSLRVLAMRSDTGAHKVMPTVLSLLAREEAIGVSSTDYYSGFQEKTNRIKDDFLCFLLGAKRDGKTVAAYGAAAKGNTLMNYAGIRPDLISFVVDKNPAKQNKFMPGSRIPIVSEEQIRSSKPDYIVILPWNLREEIRSQLDYASEWKAHSVVAVPQMTIEPL